MKKILLLSAAVALFAACSNDREQLASDGGSEVLVPLRISASNIDVSTQVATRAANVSWASGDIIGIIGVPENTTPAAGANSVVNGFAGKYSTTDVSATYITDTYYPKNFVAETPVYLPANGSAIDVYGYYPWIPSPINPTAVTANVNADQSSSTNYYGSDFMRAFNNKTTFNHTSGALDGSTTIKKTTPTTELKFEHKFSKLKFVIRNGNGITPTNIEAISSVTISGQPTSATYNIYKNGSTSDDIPLSISSGSSPIKAYRAEAATGTVTYEAIVYPNKMADGGDALTYNSAANRTVTITLGPSDGQHEAYTFTIPSETVFWSGYEYDYDVTLHAARLVVTAAIKKWELASEKKYLTDGSHLSDLKTALTSGEATAYSGMLGCYVFSDGHIAATNEESKAIGQIAYMSDTDVDGATGTQQILVVSLPATETSIGTKNFADANTAAAALTAPAGATAWALPTCTQAGYIASYLVSGDYWTSETVNEGNAYFWDGDAGTPASGTDAKTATKKVRPIFAY